MQSLGAYWSELIRIRVPLFKTKARQTKPFVWLFYLYNALGNVSFASFNWNYFQFRFAINVTTVCYKSPLYSSVAEIWDSSGRSLGKNEQDMYINILKRNSLLREISVLYKMFKMLECWNFCLIKLVFFSLIYTLMDVIRIAFGFEGFCLLRIPKKTS